MRRTSVGAGTRGGSIASRVPGIATTTAVRSHRRGARTRRDGLLGLGRAPAGAAAVATPTRQTVAPPAFLYSSIAVLQHPTAVWQAATARYLAGVPPFVAVGVREGHARYADGAA